MRRATLLGSALVACLLVLSGCSKKGYELDMQKTIPFDPKTSGQPVVMGGPGSKVQATGNMPFAGKGKQGVPPAAGKE
jgi:hypothetical protein